MVRRKANYTDGGSECTLLKVTLIGQRCENKKVTKSGEMNVKRMLGSQSTTKGWCRGFVRNERERWLFAIWLGKRDASSVIKTLQITVHRNSLQWKLIAVALSWTIYENIWFLHFAAFQ